MQVQSLITIHQSRFWRITAWLALAISAPACAQPYPAKPVRIITPFAPGGPGDLLPRALATGLAPVLGQQVVVENRPGASTIIGMQAVAKSPPDGYTLGFGSVTSFAINPSTFSNLPYNPQKDLAPLALCFTTPLYLAVHPSLPAKSVKELIALARLRPGVITFASGGKGTTNHLAGELFKVMARVEMLHVPYKSAGPAMVDVMAGHVDIMFAAAGLSDARAGKVRVLATTSARRFPGAADVPTLQEAGLPGYEATLWFGMVVPAGTPGDTVARLWRDTETVLGQPALRERFSTLDVTPGGPEVLARLIAEEIPKWRKVIEAAKIAPE